MITLTQTKFSFWETKKAIGMYWKELFKSLKNTFLLIGQNSNQDHNFQEGFKYCFHIALVYCPTSEKQILFAVVITIWMLPIYTVIVFSGYIFMQFCRTISENFKQLRHDIGEKSRQVIFFLSDLGNKILNKTKILKRNGSSKYS